MDETTGTNGNILGVLSGTESLKGELKIETKSIWTVALAIIVTSAAIITLTKVLR